MEKFKKQSLERENFFNGDDGIQINELLKLIKKSDYYNDILEYFNIDQDDTTKIDIKGSKSLFTKIKKINEKYVKEDLISDLKDLNFDYNGGFGIKFNNLTTNQYLNDLKIDSFKAYPIHSGERDFFIKEESYYYNILVRATV